MGLGFIFSPADVDEQDDRLGWCGLDLARHNGGPWHPRLCDRLRQGPSGTPHRCRCWPRPPDPELRNTVEVNAYKITADNGATVEVLAADGGSMFGLRGSFYICDEICQWGETRNVRRVWSAIVSALGKVKGCRFVCLSSAGEPSHWSHKVINDARKSDAWRVHEVAGPSPWMSPEVLAAQRPMLRDSEWSRLILNQWTQSEDRLVNAEDLEAAAVLDGPL